MAVIPVQLADDDIKKIDFLIQIGRYKNRSQALRSMIHSNLDQEIYSKDWDNHEEDSKRQQIVQRLLLKKKNFEGTWLSSESAADLIRQDRDER